jgi:hypothetical protein
MRNLASSCACGTRRSSSSPTAKGDDDGGSGLPELRDWADVYAWRKDQWKAAMLT